MGTSRYALYIVVLLNFCFLSCKNKDNSKAEKTQTTKSNKGCEKCLSDWKDDKEGCLKLRSVELFKKINKEYNLTGKQKKYVLFLLGKSNLVENDNIDGKPTEIYSYYIMSVCKNDSVIKDSDKCYIVLYFQENVLRNVGYPCE